MSHFSVLVTGDVKRALAPFHEFECTGIDDQYVQDVDRTNEAREQYASNTSTRIKLPDGTLTSFFDEKGEWKPGFSAEEPGGFGSRRTYFVPDGHEKVEVPTSEVESFAEWVSDYYGAEILPHGQEPDKDEKHKYGYVQLDEAGDVVKVIKRTNPNAKWDWWVVGGRWSGKLILKSGSVADHATAAEIDWDAMQAKFRGEAAKEWDAVMSVVNGRTFETWDELLAKHKAGEMTIDAAREVYGAQPVVIDLLAAKAIDNWDGAETLSVMRKFNTRDAYVDAMGKTNATTWAMVHDGQWNERGRMGWFGTSNATEDSTMSYVDGFWETVRALAPDVEVSVVDCHI